MPGPAAATPASAVAPPGEPAGDKGCDANHLRPFLAGPGNAAVMPGTRSRKPAMPQDAERGSLGNGIGRTFCRIEERRGIATLCDKTARNCLAAPGLVCAITCRA